MLAGTLAFVPGVALAHGETQEKPSLSTLWDSWEFDPLFIVPAVAVTWAYVAGVRRVNREHPTTPFPRQAVACFLSGIGALVLAVMSPIAAYDTELFSVHMIQHLLIAMVAAPLLLLGKPITLILRVSSPSFRKAYVLPVLHSRPLKVLAFPVLAWLLFAAVMWMSHFSSLFDAALENEWWHRAEHAIFLGSALLFWWPAVAADPGPWRLSHPVRLLYVFLQMPQSSFLAVAIYSANTVIFDHYQTVARDWGPTPLEDQQLAGAIMWVGGDLLFIVALVCIAYGWVKAEERNARREDRALARQRTAAQSAGTGPGPGG